jgi:DNA invertase Pin-like site-specific DNA recombinase
MAVIGYARVSTTDQDLSIQEAALRATGCEVIRAEKRSGTTTQGREQLRTVLDFLRNGDVLMVTHIDRLARLLRPLANEGNTDAQSRLGHMYADGQGVPQAMLRP